MDQFSLPLGASAPGKAILFGEHAVVHGKTAVALSLGLRAECILKSSNQPLITIDFPDLQLYRTWTHRDLEEFYSHPFLYNLDGNYSSKISITDQM